MYTDGCDATLSATAGAARSSPFLAYENMVFGAKASSILDPNPAFPGLFKMDDFIVYHRVLDYMEIWHQYAA